MIGGSLVSSKYVRGGITGFAAATAGYVAGEGVQGLLTIASFLCIAAMWYYAGRRDRQ